MCGELLQKRSAASSQIRQSGNAHNRWLPTCPVWVARATICFGNRARPIDLAKHPQNVEARYAVIGHANVLGKAKRLSRYGARGSKDVKRAFEMRPAPAVKLPWRSHVSRAVEADSDDQLRAIRPRSRLRAEQVSAISRSGANSPRTIVAAPRDRSEAMKRSDGIFGARRSSSRARAKALPVFRLNAYPVLEVVRLP